MKKRNLIASIVLCAGLIFSNSSVIFAGENNDSVDKFTIQILHTNDTHGSISSDQGFGFDRISTLAKQEKRKNKNTLLVDAGDVFNGTSLVDLDKGETAINILKKSGYDFMTIGNADFSYGYNRILELKDEVSNPKILNANIFRDGKRDFEPYEIVDMNGVKIGLFGLITQQVQSKEVEVKDPVEISKDIVSKLKQEGADVIIAISHIGEVKGEYLNSQEIVEQVDGIDLIVDGHSHTKLPDGIVVNDTLIVQTGENNNNVGKVEINIENKKIVNKSAQLLNIDDYIDIEKDMEVNKLIKEAQEKSDSIYSGVVGHTDVDLDGERSTIRTKETNLGDIVADSIRIGTNSEIALVPSAVIRASIKSGDITKENIAKVFSVGSKVNQINVSGRKIVGILEKSLASFPEENGMFFQVSGLTFCIDPTKEMGSRVYNIKVNGEDLDLQKEYTVATDENIAVNLAKSNEIKEFDVYDGFFINYLKVNGTENYKYGRIIVKEQSINIGDINNDNVINIRDYIRLQKYILGKENNISIKNSDIDGSGVIDQNDLILLKEMFL